MLCYVPTYIPNVSNKKCKEDENPSIFFKKQCKQFEPLQTQIDSYNTKIKLQTLLNPSELPNYVKLWKEEMWSQQSAIFTISIVQKLDIISLTKTWL